MADLRFISRHMSMVQTYIRPFYSGFCKKAQVLKCKLICLGHQKRIIITGIPNVETGDQM